MPVTKPTAYPEFAEVLDPSDATSGEPSRITPTTALENSGFTLLGYLARNVLNYLLNLTSNWFKWFDQEVGELHVRVADDAGVDVIPYDDTMCLVFAIETGTSNYVFGYGERVGSADSIINTLSNSQLTIGTESGANIPIANAVGATVTVIVLSWETQ